MLVLLTRVIKRDLLWTKKGGNLKLHNFELPGSRTWPDCWDILVLDVGLYFTLEHYLYLYVVCLCLCAYRFRDTFLVAKLDE